MDDFLRRAGLLDAMNTHYLLGWGRGLVIDIFGGWAVGAFHPLIAIDVDFFLGTGLRTSGNPRHEDQYERGATDS